MNRCRISVVLLLLLFAASCSKKKDAPTADAPATSKNDSVPKISVTEPDFDFGRAKQGETVSHIYKIKNVGAKELVIEKTHGSWGCTATVATTGPIPPGGEGEVKATMSTKGRQGNVTKRITVYSNDPETPQLRLSLKGEIVMDIKMTPSILTFGDVVTGEQPAKTFDLEILDPQKVTLKSVKSMDERIVVTQLSSDDKGKATFEAKLNDTTEKGRIYTKLELELEGTKVPKLEYTVRANVVSNLRYSPHLYLLKRNGKYQPREVHIKSRNEKKFTITSATDPDKNLKLEIKKKSPNETLLVASLKNPEVTLKETLKGTITLKTTDSTDPEFTIKYTATTRNAGSRTRLRAMKNRHKQHNASPKISPKTPPPKGAATQP